MDPREHARGLGLALMATCALAPSVFAHDFWIEPASWQPEAGRPLGLGIRVGDSFPGQELGRAPDFVRRFVVRHGEKIADLPALPGRPIPAAAFRPEVEGRYTVAYEGKARAIELEPAKFHAYLREEGLEHVIDAREARDEVTEPGRECYVRCAKVHVDVGDPTPWAYEPPMGLPLELELLSDPNGKEKLRARLLWGGEPVEGVLVTAMPKRPKAGNGDAPDAPKHGHDDRGADHAHDHAPHAKHARHPSARTDAKGCVEFELDRAGTWLIAAVHMERIDEPTEGLDGDWLSHWASLCLEKREQGRANRGGESTR